MIEHLHTVLSVNQDKRALDLLHLISPDSQNFHDLHAPLHHAPAPKSLPSICNNRKEYCKPRATWSQQDKSEHFLACFHWSLSFCQLAPASSLPTTNPPPHLCPEAQHSRPLFSFLPLHCYNAADYLYLFAAFYIPTCIFSLFCSHLCSVSPTQFERSLRATIVLCYLFTLKSPAIVNLQLRWG